MRRVNPFNDRLRFGSQLGLERITELCRRLGNPQNHFKAIHIAGTNGKGSVASMLANILSHNNYRTGMFTSPHLVDYRERFQIDDQWISSDQLESITDEVNLVMENIELTFPELGMFTEFEAATAVGFMYFAHNKVDYAVIEVGLGGRLDATNVVNPLISVITPVSYDHQDRLGETIAEIANEKAGIIKLGSPVVVGKQVIEAEQALRMRAEQLGCDYTRVEDVNWRPLDWSLAGGEIVFPYFSDSIFKVGLLGKHQLENAATVLTVLKKLNEIGLKLEPTKIQTGLATAKWPGRLQLISQKPLLLLDGAHNQEGIAALVDSLAKILKPSDKITFLVGLSANKSPSLLEPLFSFAKRMIVTEVKNSRVGSLDPREVCHYLNQNDIDGQCFETVEQALNVISNEDQVCICGSLYLIGEVQAKLKQVFT